MVDGPMNLKEESDTCHFNKTKKCLFIRSPTVGDLFTSPALLQIEISPPQNIAIHLLLFFESFSIPNIIIFSAPLTKSHTLPSSFFYLHVHSISILVLFLHFPFHNFFGCAPFKLL